MPISTLKHSGGLPLIRLGLILPYIQELQRRQIDAEAILDGVGLNMAAVRSNDTFVIANRVYDFVEAAAAAADDPYFGFRVGESLNLYAWPGFEDLLTEAKSVSDFLIRFVLLLVDHGTSVTHALEIHGETARAKAIRLPPPEAPPAQIDGSGIGIWSRVLQQSVGENWVPQQVLISVCDPGALPGAYLGATIARCGSDGPSIRFPARWLLAPLARSSFARERMEATVLQKPANTLIASLRQALLPHVQQTDLSVEKAAHICGFKKSTLARKLKAEGTTLADEISALKRDCALAALADTDRSVAEIAASLGFSDPTNFTRCFRHWTGQSPRAYRKSHANDGLDNTLPKKAEDETIRTDSDFRGSVAGHR